MDELSAGVRDCLLLKRVCFSSYDFMEMVVSELQVGPECVLSAYAAVSIRGPVCTLPQRRSFRMLERCSVSSETATDAVTAHATHVRMRLVCADGCYRPL